jgi:hypothetical protein
MTHSTAAPTSGTNSLLKLTGCARRKEQEENLTEICGTHSGSISMQPRSNKASEQRNGGCFSVNSVAGFT